MKDNSQRTALHIACCTEGLLNEELEQRVLATVQLLLAAVAKLRQNPVSVMVPVPAMPALGLTMTSTAGRLHKMHGTPRRWCAMKSSVRHCCIATYHPQPCWQDAMAF